MTAINSQHEWKERVGPIEQKIRDFHADLVETTPPNPPHNVRRIKNVLRWKPPVAAADGDTAACYLVFDDRRLIGTTARTSFELPATAGRRVSVVAVDDSFRDNRSAATAATSYKER